MNFYKHFLGDYIRSTADLSLTEHGAYRLMLDQFYSTGWPLPGDKKALYRVLRAESQADKQAIDNVRFRFWRPLPDELDELYAALKLNTDEEQARLRKIAQRWGDAEGLINVRALGEIMKADAIAEKNRHTALAREAMRRMRAAEGRGD